MVDHCFLVERQANKRSVLLSIQPKIFFGAKLTVADFRVFDCLEQLSSKEIAGKDSPLCRTIAIVGQEAADDY